jgi:uncharacterized protein involved in cysteine biosynthesis
VIDAFVQAARQLGDRQLRSVIWQSLALSLALQIAVGALAWLTLQRYLHFDISVLNTLVHWLGGAAMVGLSLILFPASFGIVVSIFMERIADIVERAHYPGLGPARGISIWTGLWTGLVFFVGLLVLNFLMLLPYLAALLIFGSGAVLFYALNGWLTGRLYYEQVALRRRSPAEVKAWRRANVGTLWAAGTVIVFLGTIPVLNLIVPVLGTAAMVHIAQTLRPPPFRSPGNSR